MGGRFAFATETDAREALPTTVTALGPVLLGRAVRRWRGQGRRR
ncbi:hypothetical protein [Kitasatospora sp. MMS16-BH015]|nr:hypothetical protein [Kitasatospora sp. MMS16-BH015]